MIIWNFCQAERAQSVPDDLENGHLSDDEGEDGTKEEKIKKKDKKKKKKKEVMLLANGYCVRCLSNLLNSTAS